MIQGSTECSRSPQSVCVYARVTNMTGTQKYSKMVTSLSFTSHTHAMRKCFQPYLEDLRILTTSLSLPVSTLVQVALLSCLGLQWAPIGLSASTLLLFSPPSTWQQSAQLT